MEVIKNILPHQTNIKILLNLINHNNWCFPTDTINDKKIILEKFFKYNESNSGMMLMSYDKSNNINLNSPLNLYGELIFDIIKSKSTYKLNDLVRIYWNYYDNSSVMKEHKDMLDDKHISIVYNLNNNDGGTEINKKFIESEESTAIIFKSNTLHKAVAPVKEKHRFSLNIVTTKQE
jgi:hypothetical protein